ncbi:MAG: DUF4340 domain-containing protein [Deltaproteobacteria bacterium]|nr:MAG: DUF4340 domain-containing protein [Deltaproteobacteria bacterium]
MNRTTGIFVLAAAASLAWAVAMRPSPPPEVTFEETGTVMFPQLTDPTQATSLEVVAWDDEAATVRRFKVEQKDGVWVIPSHHDYPADAAERMGKAAAGFVDVRREIYYGDDPSEHGAFGLLDPEDPGAKADEKARRFILKDAAGTVLVDVLVGKPIPGKEGYRYVRLPDDKRVYGAKLDLDISTNFTDWIEKDLLRLDRDDVVTIVYDPYEVDEAKGRVVGEGALEFRRKKGEGGTFTDEWELGENTKAPAGKTLDVGKVRSLLGAIDRLQIVGVRPRPERLTLPLLQSYGFFVNPRTGRLFGNEGEVSVVEKDGVVYSLFFGEVTFDSGLALTAGKESSSEEGTKGGEAGGEDEDEGKTGEDGADEGASKGGGNRYLFVDVGFDPKLVAEGGDPEKGKTRAEKLRKRFDKWFFVISESSFDQIHKDRDAFFKDAG